MEKISYVEKFWDKLGICTSTVCIVHCLVTPILLIAFPAASPELTDSTHLHEIFGVFVVSSILIAVYPACIKHGHKDIIIAALTGITLILTSLFLIHDSTTTSHILTILGSIALITAHVKNMKVRHGSCGSKSKCPTDQ